MKLLVLGHSSTSAYGVMGNESHPRVLETLLRDSFPDRDVTVDVKGWGVFSRERQSLLLGEIDQRRPDYVLFDTTYAWVTVPWGQALRRSLPTGVPTVIRFAHNLQKRWDHWLLGKHRSVPYSLYRQAYCVPMRALGHRLFGSEPMYSVEESLAYLDQTIRAVMQREEIEFVVIGPKPQALRPFWAAQFPQYREYAREFFTGLKSLCSRYRLTFVDVGPPLDPRYVSDILLADHLHYTSKAHRLVAEAVHAAIIDREQP